MGERTHDYPITFGQANVRGLHVRGKMDKEFNQLMSLYPQPVRHKASVEYLPLPKLKK
ncbi:hypothetical protein BR63_16990 [Thermanaerosceptrum fracticalcis]|uniref:Uncharacterized protein n=1 Tax=Thermanaerosceptrum fracticalcis TaxID=1712410 RepID=A0A7G6E8T7_THEFR|nr:hypothetical protein BR63_16990 [Thermanaerosceptrum fracticalcis]